MQHEYIWILVSIKKSHIQMSNISRYLFYLQKLIPAVINETTVLNSIYNTYCNIQSILRSKFTYSQTLCQSSKFMRWTLCQSSNLNRRTLCRSSRDRSFLNLMLYKETTFTSLRYIMLAWLDCNCTNIIGW